MVLTKPIWNAKMSFLQIQTVRRLSLKPSTVVVVCFLLSWLGRHEIQAQQILIRTGGKNAELETYNQINGILEGERDAARNRIQSKLLDIDRACELSPKQKTRLKVASKGAVVSYSDSVTKILEQSSNTIGFEFKKGKPPKANPDAEDNAIVGRFHMLDLGGKIDKLAVETESIWVASIKKTLTEAQAEKLKAWTMARQKMIRQAAVAHLIAKVDLKMFLSREQSQKLKAYVDQKYGPQLAQQMKTPPKRNRGFVPGAVQVGLPQGKRKVTVDESLKEILSDSQLEIWKSDFHDDLESLEDD